MFYGMEGKRRMFGIRLNYRTLSIFTLYGLHWIKWSYIDSFVVRNTVSVFDLTLLVQVKNWYGKVKFGLL